MTDYKGNHEADRRWALIGVPSAAGARRQGQDTAPRALRAAGLVERLRAAGVDVLDLGDSRARPFEDPRDFGPDRSARRVSEVVREVRELVDRARTQGRTPLVLGGDCTITLGVLSAFRRTGPVGLTYFDADLDLNTPDTSPSGAFDGMVLALALGYGDTRITGRDPGDPLVEPAHVTLFAFDVDSGWVDPPEVERLRSLDALLFPLERVRGREAEAARQAVTEASRRTSRSVLHFDVDVTRLPSADVPHPNGLMLEAATEALSVFAREPGCAALVVTEYNPEADAHGRDARDLVAAIVSAVRPGGP